ncbi:RNA-binding protein Nova-1 [Dorcoceras hygrometricum]|uniref:RNA-binding protein Nova-1 n=1 Tax=Dorcoceras hygrometricum TaxID=472368 RepID=A0A2Z7A835_9LAMI|nr:RNA-binding protein Nova-1 [Dorcoceras hygrometricum]
MRREQPQHTDVDPSAPATMAGAPPDGPPPGPAGHNLTNLSPSHAPYGSNEGKETRCTLRPTQVNLRVIGVVDARSGHHRIWITNLDQKWGVRIFVSLRGRGGRLDEVLWASFV